MTFNTIAQQIAAIPNPLSPWPEQPLPSAAAVADMLQLIRETIVAKRPNDQLSALNSPLGPKGRFHEAKRLKELSTIFGQVAELVGDRAVAQAFVEHLPELIRRVRSDIVAIAENDPAATSVHEVALCYPAVTAMLCYRTAHQLHRLGQPLLARIITEQAHSQTGIDIHPAATIGEAFAIDHGTGVVIGSTAIVGNHVTIYQGVTLGARHFSRDADGRLADKPRHPIVEDHVTIYSNTSVLGRIRIGHHSVIGGNLWITHDVEAQSVIRQQKPVKHLSFSDGAGI